jgi:hypothetical protein
LNESAQKKEEIDVTEKNDVLSTTATKPQADEDVSQAEKKEDDSKSRTSQASATGKREVIIIFYMDIIQVNCIYIHTLNNPSLNF